MLASFASDHWPEVPRNNRAAVVAVAAMTAVIAVVGCFGGPARDGAGRRRWRSPPVTHSHLSPSSHPLTSYLFPPSLSFPSAPHLTTRTIIVSCPSPPPAPPSQIRARTPSVGPPRGSDETPDLAPIKRTPRENLEDPTAQFIMFCNRRLKEAPDFTTIATKPHDNQAKRTIIELIMRSNRRSARPRRARCRTAGGRWRLAPRTRIKTDPIARSGPGAGPGRPPRTRFASTPSAPDRAMRDAGPTRPRASGSGGESAPRGAGLGAPPPLP